MEQNPYESPRVPEPLTTSTVIKRTISVTLILLLTPLAVGIAFGGSCAATIAFVDSSAFGEDYGMVFVVASSIFLIPPVAVLVGMVWWASRVRVRVKGVDPNKPSSSD
ncbi:hypothetical protein ETAA8_48540 [Anatilimnocola aggregata]|uniref:Uncharacterized protein n=1 Tax=Anatilimnocola aggregata TaxID=2528021 RepID=A0A517YHQ0_9BACT|nr:hypothetical protein ETAA8_48540 [Anatilimnocola aggregata]